MNSKIKLILFDLDGVITDTKDIHYEVLNKAISEVDPIYIITEREHINKYDGLKTGTKLKMLTDEKGLPINTHQQIYNRKQQLTLEKFAEIKTDEKIISVFKSLKNEGYLLGCCTNSIRRTTLVALAKTGVIE
jgi:beta-phosphoglucomutase-like phosphatase (HAD superfamily)